MWIDIEQNTDEWLNLRMKKATSSNFPKIMANEDKAFGNPAVEYAQKIALEIVTNERDERSGFKNSFMQDGQEFEPVAVRLYEMETMYDTSNGGFHISSCKNFGDSPDIRIGDKGGAEVKSVIPNTQWKRLKKGGFDTAYKWQIHGHIWLGELDWCDFVSYCPEMPENKQLYVFRVHRDQNMIDRLQKRISLFWKEVEKNVEILKL